MNQNIAGMDCDVPAAERVRALLGHPTAGVAYQAVALAGARIVYRVLQRERQAAEATISLAQRQKLQHMVESLEQTYAAVCSSLSAPCVKVEKAMANAERRERLGETNWWFALTEAIEALDSGIEAIVALVSAQPKGVASRLLAAVVVGLLHRHRSELLKEAEQWIG